MKKVFGIIGNFAIFTLMVTPAFSGSPKGKPFVYLNNQIAEVKASVSSIQEQIDSIVQNVSSLEERVGAFDAAISNLESQNMTLAAEISSYGMSINSMMAQISGLQSENAWLKSQIEAVNAGRIDQLQVQIDENAAKIASFQTAINDISSLESQIANNTTLIQSLNGEVVKINGYLELKQNIVNGFCPSGSAIREILADGSVVCTPEGSGSNGIYYSRSYNMVEIPASQSRPLTVSCPSGYIATGGGFSGYEVVAKTSIPSESGNSWDLYLNFDSRYGSTIGYGYAACVGGTRLNQ
ncbi:MAG: hypothetical protein JXK94_13110 [Deltaproteobacteria bacterium]|nr:hypothetical protein [Deltaproteobacteria bacterium]